MFKIIHISDLHIHGGSSQKNQQHRHSIPHMKGVESIIRNNESDADLVLVTGDISDYGDNNSLLLGRQWIYNSLEIGNKEKTSIGVSENNYGKLRIIPGNHDAWNSNTKIGKTNDRRQKSLANFNYVFPEHQFDSKFACYYDWLEKSDHSLFFVFLDSSYLGDTEVEKDNPDLAFFDKIAKGRISREQAEYVLELFDKGMKGKLEHKGQVIPKGKFNQSLKIIVMHHYLFEPIGFKSEHFLQLNDRNTVFANLALADFDILLCGHKHISAFNDYQYVNYFGKRAKYRYLFNYFRRLIGTHSLPIQLIEKSGNKVSKLLTILLELILLKKITQNHDNDDLGASSKVMEELVEVFRRGLENPAEFEDQFRIFFKKHDPKAMSSSIIDEKEIRDIIKRVKIDLTDADRVHIRKLAENMKEIIKKLSTRQFLQIMAGSACKSSGKNEKNRSFNIYNIEPTEFGYRFHCDKYAWDKENNEFSEDPIRKTHEFNMQSRPKF